MANGDDERSAIYMMIGSGTGVTYLARDSFTDTNDTALSSHTAETGGAWTLRAGSWTIQSNAAAPDATTGDQRATQASIAANASFQVDIRRNVSDADAGGIIYREASNQSALLTELEWVGNQVQTYTRSNTGSYSSLGASAVTLGIDQWYTLLVVTSGSSITISVGGTEVGTVTNTTNQTETGTGLRADPVTVGNLLFDLWQAT